VISPFQILVHHFNVGVGAGVGPDVQKRIDLRVALIDEESKETVAAMKVSDPVAIIDGLCDILYVTYGAADVFGLEIDTTCEEEQTVDGRCDWPEIHGSQNDLLEEANLAMAAIRKQDPKEMRVCLQSLAVGCWDCAAQGLGIDLRPFFREVHRTNMWKLKGPKREDGKQLKPEGWKPPRLAAMYNRLTAGNPPACVHFDEGVAVAATPHPQGGHFCEQCGGLFVDWMEA
jgi:hypothetical protein